jgi:hypothetical protein
MGLKSQYQVKIRQAKKRKKARQQIAKKGLNLTDFYYNKFYLK